MGTSQGHILISDHLNHEEFAREVKALKSQVDEQPSYLREIKGMLESLGSKLENRGKRPSTDGNHDQEESLKCRKLGYALRKQKAPIFNEIVRRENEAEAWLVNIERHMLLYDFNSLEKTKFASYQFTDYANLWWDHLSLWSSDYVPKEERKSG